MECREHERDGIVRSRVHVHDQLRAIEPPEPPDNRAGPSRHAQGRKQERSRRRDAACGSDCTQESGAQSNVAVTGAWSDQRWSYDGARSTTTELHVSARPGVAAM
ncbi:hypothetical protein LY15_001685 [Prauserella flava]|uniref:Uncharacterized protein n=1 Tax=Prauserella sediminis TaxID=577680 RepID=A0A839XDJ4_9PSEU|nr:hypothetical protein [Prauserella sediminis]MCR3719711.1 hypothetical protein [Prauserella flava]